MGIIEVVFLLLIVLFGVITSYTDFKCGKIKNKHLFLFGGIAFVLNFILFWYLFLKDMIRIDYLVLLEVNVLAAFFIGYLFYHFEIWSAGDGKLFFIFMLMTPLSYYTSENFLNWPVLILLINIFLIAFIVFFIMSLFSLNQKKLSFKYFKKNVISGSPGNLFVLIIQMFSLMWIVNLLFNFIGIDIPIFLNFVLIFVAMRVFRRILKKYLLLLLLITVFRFIFDYSIYSFDFLYHFVLYVVLFRLLKKLGWQFLSYFTFVVFTDKVSAADISTGMYLSDVIVKKKKMSKAKLYELTKADIEFRTYGDYNYVKYQFNADGKSLFDTKKLTNDDVEFLKNLGFSEYNISRTAPFAFCIFVGALFSYFFKMDIISFFRSLLQ